MTPNICSLFCFKQVHVSRRSSMSGFSVSALPRSFDEFLRFGAGMQSFTSSEVSQRTGLTPRQLQWWDEQRIVTPARQGHRRLYSAEDLAELSILSDLRRRGFSLQRIRRMLALLRRAFGQIAERSEE